MSRNKFRASTLACSLCVLMAGGTTETKGAPKTSPTLRPPRNLVLEIYEVKCRDETNKKNIEKVGGDEIALSAVTIDPAGAVEKARKGWNGHFEKDGVVKKLLSPLPLATFTMRAKFPSVYQVFLILAERDKGGGMGEYIDALVQNGGAIAKSTKKRDGTINMASDVAKEAAIKAAASGRVSPEGFLAAVGEVIGEKAMAKGRELAERAWKDDIFPPNRVKIRIPSADFRFPNGAMVSDPETAVFKAFHGEYHVTYAWRLVP
jgi:hypothetical protein